MVALSTSGALKVATRHVRRFNPLAVTIVFSALAGFGLVVLAITLAISSGPPLAVEVTGPVGAAFLLVAALGALQSEYNRPQREDEAA